VRWWCFFHVYIECNSPSDKVSPTTDWLQYFNITLYKCSKRPIVISLNKLKTQLYPCWLPKTKIQFCGKVVENIFTFLFLYFFDFSCSSTNNVDDNDDRSYVPLYTTVAFHGSFPAVINTYDGDIMYTYVYLRNTLLSFSDLFRFVSLASR
jgi:hypothetical protein